MIIQSNPPKSILNGNKKTETLNNPMKNIRLNNKIQIMPKVNYRYRSDTLQSRDKILKTFRSTPIAHSTPPFT